LGKKIQDSRPDPIFSIKKIFFDIIIYYSNLTGINEKIYIQYTI